MKFISNVLATVVGIFVFFMVSFFLLFLFAALFGSGNSDTVTVKSNSVIELDLSNIELDYAGKVHYDDFSLLNGNEKHNGLFDVINAIEHAKKDDNIKGISILNNQSNLGIAQAKALRDALEDFKKSGKFVYSYADAYSQRDYYLNSVANKLYINPIGELEFKGLSTEVMFFKDFEDKTGLKMEIIRHGKYKSAVEPFLENKMSDANREQTTELLNSIWSSIVDDVAKSRNISVDKLNQIADGLLARTPEMALQEKLIDKIAYEDVYHNDIKKALKIDTDKEYDKVSIEDYADNVATTAVDISTKNKIALIYAQGDILNGEGDVNEIGEGSMRRSLKEAREDEKVKAIVLRVNSPGGNALTSELIWREIELTKKVKPVVVSMGNYAASGGYYISCNANTIFAEENTITGSIGVFGMLPNVTKAASNLGINTEVVKTHENASGFSPFVPLDEKTRAFTQEGVEQIYTTFITRVANGRKMTTAQVDSIGQGRVWSGKDAIKIGLVDKIGGMDDAIAEAVKLAKIKEYRTVDYPEFEKSFSDVLEKFGLAKTKEAVLKEELGTENYIILQKIKRLSQLKGIQARMPYEIKID
jgi:protease IV